MNHLTQDNPMQVNTVQQRRKKKFIDFVIAANEVYYQLLYYVSGVVILGCSYDWSFVSLAIVILTVIGLLVTYSNKLVISVLILNLLFIFTNYLVILINTYNDVMT